MNLHRRPVGLKAEHRRGALDLLEHAGGRRGEEQLRGIERVRLPRRVRVECDLRRFASCDGRTDAAAGRGDSSIGIAPSYRVRRGQRRRGSR